MSSAAASCGRASRYGWMAAVVGSSFMGGATKERGARLRLSIRVSTVPSQVCVGSKPGCRVPPKESVRETMRCFVVP
jgi:hypothetical protein